jgi:hypothetical protein
MKSKWKGSRNSDGKVKKNSDGKAQEIQMTRLKNPVGKIQKLSEVLEEISS